MFKVMYQRFWFSKVITADPTTQNVFFAYCIGKSFLWNIFFGWRYTSYKDGSMIFWLPANKLSSLDDCIKYIHRHSDEIVEII